MLFVVSKIIGFFQSRPISSFRSGSSAFFCLLTRFARTGRRCIASLILLAILGLSPLGMR